MTRMAPARRTHWFPSLALAAVLLAAAPGVVAARTLDVREAIELRMVRKSGSVIWERGEATGTISGKVSAKFDVRVTKVTGSVTIRPRGGGSLTINVVGYPTSGGVNAAFEGTMAVRRGTGKYARAVGSGTFSGTLNRKTWAASVRASGRLTF